MNKHIELARKLAAAVFSVQYGIDITKAYEYTKNWVPGQEWTNLADVLLGIAEQVRHEIEIEEINGNY